MLEILRSSLENDIPRIQLTSTADNRRISSFFSLMNMKKVGLENTVLLGCIIVLLDVFS